LWRGGRESPWFSKLKTTHKILTHTAPSRSSTPHRPFLTKKPPTPPKAAAFGLYWHMVGIILFEKLRAPPGALLGSSQAGGCAGLFSSWGGWVV